MDKRLRHDLGRIEGNNKNWTLFKKVCYLSHENRSRNLTRTKAMNSQTCPNFEWEGKLSRTKTKTNKIESRLQWEVNYSEWGKSAPLKVVFNLPGPFLFAYVRFIVYSFVFLLPWFCSQIGLNFHLLSLPRLWAKASHFSLKSFSNYLVTNVQTSNNTVFILMLLET